MSNYTIAVNWSGKDALSDSDPAKVISGSDFNTEFSAAQTAINSKANINGDVTEAFSTATASSSSNTTVAASTQYVTSAVSTVSSTLNSAITTATSGHDTKANTLLAAYPVGCVYTSVVSTNPSSLFGGTWVAFGAGRVLVGRDSSDSDFNTSQETGGSKTDSHALTTAEMPSHQHGTNIRNEYQGVHPSTSGTSWSDGNANDGKTSGGGYTGLTNAAGSGNAHTHDIVQPYIVVYFFKRTA